MINYWHLFSKLLDDIIFHTILRLRSLWYSHRKVLGCGIKLYQSHSASTMTLDKVLYYRHICIHDISMIFY